jgi:3alpha(or 20beta)-hydroxysteroid dehydrogenase
MSERLEGKVALITGAAMGQGAAEARLFAEHGARVAVADIAATTEVVTDLGDRALAVDLDVADEAQWAAAVAATIERFGRIDILVNNAGVGFPPRPLGEELAEHHHKLWAVNADGVYFGMRAVAPVMSAQRSGSIVNVSSIDGMAGVAGMMSYTATKFAVTGMTKVAALELGAHGIRVNSIHPGVIATPMVDAAPPETLERLQRVLARQPIPRMGTPEEVAYLVLYLASDESSYCTGSQFVIDGGHLAGPYREGYGPGGGPPGSGPPPDSEVDR